MTNLIIFCDEIMGLVDEGRTVDIVNWDFHEVFDTVLHRILIEKLMK